MDAVCTVSDLIVPGHSLFVGREIEFRKPLGGLLRVNSISAPEVALKCPRVESERRGPGPFIITSHPSGLLPSATVGQSNDEPTGAPAAEVVARAGRIALSVGQSVGRSVDRPTAGVPSCRRGVSSYQLQILQPGHLNVISAFG